MRHSWLSIRPRTAQTFRQSSTGWSGLSETVHSCDALGRLNWMDDQQVRANRLSTMIHTGNQSRIPRCPEDRGERVAHRLMSTSLCSHLDVTGWTHVPRVVNGATPDWTGHQLICPFLPKFVGLHKTVVPLQQL